MDRRRHKRVPLEVWVEHWTARESYLQKSANISRGGIFLEQAVPHPEGTLLNLRFTLPGEQAPIECTGRIVYPKTGEAFGMGLAFEAISPDAQARVDAYLSRCGAADPDPDEGARGRGPEGGRSRRAAAPRERQK